jgi:hypothetical protein
LFADDKNLKPVLQPLKYPKNFIDHRVAPDPVPWNLTSFLPIKQSEVTNAQLPAWFPPDIK